MVKLKKKKSQNSYMAQIKDKDTDKTQKLKFS